MTSGPPIPSAAHTPAAADDARHDAPADGDGRRPLLRLGRSAWAFVGVVAALVVVGYVASRLTVLVVPVILALFPATLLVPVARWLRARGVPSALAAILTIVMGIALIVGALVVVGTVVASQAPELAETAAEGIGDLRTTLQERFGVEIGGLSDLMERVRAQAPEAGELLGRAASGATAAAELLTSLVLMLVVLFFYLKDGRRLLDGVLSVTPRRIRGDVAAVAERSWGTLGAYFRGQLAIALVDAVCIGIGLLVLGVPLALPLTVLIFFGGLFPVVGAVTTGALAVLVALADQGLTTALIVLAIVLVVQQLEGNILEPLILGHAIHLHPLVVILSITAGALLMGVLGAFLAVPVAAVVAEVVEHVRGDEDQEPGARQPAPA